MADERKRLEDLERPWRRLTTRIVHETPWLRLREDQVELPDGARTTYTVVDAGHCVGVLPFVDDDRVVLVRQYRYVAGRATWEMPTGGVDAGERIEDAAQRELAEEVGYRAGELVPLCTYHTSKSSMDETAHLFVGTGLTPAHARGDDSDYTAASVVPFHQVLAMVLSGEITDSMTIIAVLLADRARSS